MEILILVTLFTLYLLPQAMLINGIYISAKGSQERLPNGSIAKSEMILYPIYAFLNQSTIVRVPFTFAEIKVRVGNIWPNIIGGRITFDDIHTDGFPITLTGPMALNLDPLKQWAEMYLHAKIFYNPANTTVLIYQEEEVFKFSKYLRKPIITCVICMASFWSIFTFLIPVIILFKFHIEIIPIWIGNMFCLSYLNYLIFKARK